MLQNISRDFYTNEQNNKNSAEYSNMNQKQGTSRRLNSDEIYENLSDKNEAGKINFINTISKLFTIQNVVIYILTFLISMVGLGPNNGALIAPFGLALVIASISSGVPIAGVFLASLLGTAIKFGPSNTLVFFISAIFILLMVIIKKPVKDESVNEKIRLGGYLFFATLIVQLVYILFKGFLIYDFLVALMMSIVSYTFYKIFVNSISVISYYGIKKVFSVEEIIGASLLITIAISAIGNLSIFSFSVRNILCIFIVLMMGWRNGILVGGTSGITVGIVLGIIGNGNPMIIAAYAISGMIAGLLNKFGKIGVIAGFALGNIIVAYSANGGVNNIIMFQEILIASIGLLVLPKRTKISIQDIIPDTRLLPEAGGRLEESADTLLKLNSITETINQMANSYKNDESYEKNVNIFQDELIKALDGFEGNMLYDDIYNNEGNIIQDIFDNLQENNIITENGLISVFAMHNTYLMNSDNKNLKEIDEIRDMMKVINSSYRICKNNFIWQKKLDENNNNMAEQLKNVKDAIENITTSIQNEKNQYDEKAKEIKDILEDERIIAKDIIIKKEQSGRFIVNAYTGVCKDEEGNDCPVKTINKAVNKAMGERFSIQNQNCGIRLNKDICEYTYIAEDKYIVQIGIASAKKDGSIVSGDSISNIRLGDGKYLLAISDGMGSGADSRRNSKIAISMLERLLSSGFDKETSIKLINSAIINANKEDMYATLDIAIMDLYAGKIELLKNGACPTYVKRNKNVSVIRSTSLPAGVTNNMSIDLYDKDIQDGDILVICSDGIVESNEKYENKELWLKYLLEEIQTDIPERIADIILKEAIDNNIGKAKDDMSIIVAKLLKK